LASTLASVLISGVAVAGRGGGNWTAADFFVSSGFVGSALLGSAGLAVAGGFAAAFGFGAATASCTG
jgi:hypothetical protein